jgi:regulator of ribosome biosynthesis
MQVRGLVTMKQCLLNSIFADVDFDAGLQARADRKARVEKNEKQRLANLPRSGSSKRTEDLERTLTTTRASTASMGK